MELTLQQPTDLTMRSKGIVVGFWIVTALFRLQIAAATGMLWGLSYFFWYRVQATPRMGR